jgi:hypothetical protein
MSNSVRIHIVLGDGEVALEHCKPGQRSPVSSERPGLLALRGGTPTLLSRQGKVPGHLLHNTLDIKDLIAQWLWPVK